MDDERSHTFRKRRLSLSKHSLSSSNNSNSTHHDETEETTVENEVVGNDTTTAEKTAFGASTSDEPVESMRTLDSGYDNHDDVATSNDAAAQLHAAAAAAEAADSKAHTFRKRRLSLTHRVDFSCDDSGSHDSSHNNSINRRKRRMSEASASSYGSGRHQQPNHLTCKILHAGELFHDDDGGPPPSPAIHNSILYHRYRLQQQQKQHNLLPSLGLSLPPAPPLEVDAPPVLLEAAGAAAAGGGVIVQPRWKRRHVIKEHSKLPFPRDVVGMYSCHGMEPVYGSEYDDDEEEEVPEALQEVHEEEDVWLDDDEKQTDDDVDHVTNGGDKPSPKQMEGQQHGEQMKEQDAPSSSTPTAVGEAQLHVDRAPSHTSNTSAAALGDAATAAAAGPSAVSLAPLPPLLDPQQLLQHRSVAKINQDRGGVAFPYGNCPKTALFAVYDGHGQGGELVSQFALHEIQRRLERHKDFPSEKAFVETFRSVDEALKAEPLIEPRFAGTTACVVLLKEQSLTIANVGDSRAVIARRKQPRLRVERLSSEDSCHDDGEYEYTAIELTEDQNPDLPQEFARITDAGGYVTASPGPGLSARVWLDSSCTQIGLAMSRSIGDHSVSVVGVIADPVVTTYQLDDQDDFLIIASDGVWEFLESKDAVDVVAQNLYQNRNSKNSNRGATKACQALIEAAAAKWHEEEGDYRDDITAIVVRLQKLWTGNNAAVSQESTTDTMRHNDSNEATNRQPT